MDQAAIRAIFEELAAIRTELDKLGELPDDAIRPEHVRDLVRRLEWLCLLLLRQVEGL
jgi:8-oxo-dGTP pyrophosphatase MutT (NUDIX family)